jgi:hypothetical protein
LGDTLVQYLGNISDECGGVSLSGGIYGTY